MNLIETIQQQVRNLEKEIENQKKREKLFKPINQSSTLFTPRIPVIPEKRKFIGVIVFILSVG